MKKVQNILFLLCSLFLISCEEVIELDLETAEPKLVIDATLHWEKGTTGNQQIIRLSESTGFYNQEFPKAKNAIVWIVATTTNQIFQFSEITDGVYNCNSFVPNLNETYLLHIEYKNEIFEGTEKINPTPLISDISQDNEGGFTGDLIEVTASFQDNINEDNYYLISWKNNELKEEFEVSNDEFFNGNTMKTSYTSSDEDEELKPGSVLNIRLSSISKNSFNFISKIFSSANTGNPFASPVGAIRGNVKNITNPEKYPLGYFNILETHSQNYIVQ